MGFFMIYENQQQGGDAIVEIIDGKPKIILPGMKIRVPDDFIPKNKNLKKLQKNEKF